MASISPVAQGAGTLAQGACAHTPVKALPSVGVIGRQESKVFKSSIIARIEQDQRKNAGKSYGEEGFYIAPLSAISIEVPFAHSMPQVPLVFYSIQSTSECPNVNSITARTTEGFQITIHNMSDDKTMDGTILWHVFVQP